MVSRARPRVARAFSNRQKKIQLPPQREGTTARFFPSVIALADRDRKKKGRSRRRGAFSETPVERSRATSARCPRAHRRERGRRLRKQKSSSSHRGSHHVLVVSRCVFLKWRLTRDCFFRKSTEKETERERERERERETRGGKDATQTHDVQKNIIQPFFLSILKPKIKCT